MATINEMFPGRFLRGEDLAGPVTVTIKQVILEEMHSPVDRKPVQKWVVYFEKARKGLVLNKTNATEIARITGEPDTTDWPGQAIALYPTTVRVAGEERPAIRVKASKSGKGEES